MAGVSETKHLIDWTELDVAVFYEMCRYPEGFTKDIADIPQTQWDTIIRKIREKLDDDSHINNIIVDTIKAVLVEYGDGLYDA